VTAAIQDAGSARALAMGLRRYRTERGMQRNGMAALLGLDQSAISRIERGHRNTRMRAEDVARLLGITVEDLLSPCPQCSYKPKQGYLCLRCGTAGGEADMLSQSRPASREEPGRAVTRRGMTWADRIRQMELNGTMDMRRAELRNYFRQHPKATPAEAVNALGYTFADAMYAIADSVQMDLKREGTSE